jgi:hypothetical protein
MEPDESAHSEVTITRTTMFTARHAQDAVLEHWSDGVLDMLTSNLLR